MVRLPNPDRSAAVLIGAGRYQADALPDVASIANNLVELRRLLTHPERGGFRSERCTVVSDPQDSRDLHRLLRRSAAQATDTLLVYYAGHGLTGPRLNELYLCTGETEPDELSITALAYQQLREILLDSPAANKVVILDCCFSGRAIADLAASTDAVVSQAAVSGSYVLVATPANALALAPEDEPYTAFTAELIDALASGVGSSPYVTLADLYRHSRDRLASKGRPLPRQRGSDTVDGLALVRSPADPPPPPIASPVPARPAYRLEPDIGYIMITEDQIQAKVAELAARINADYDTSWGLRIVGMLNGGVRLAGDLARELTIDVEIDYMRVELRGHPGPDARMRILKDLDRDIAGCHVLVVDNLLVTGASMAWLLKYMESRGAASAEGCVLLRKPDSVEVMVPISYIGFDIPDEQVVGYALDYGDRYWNLPYIGVLRPEVWSREPIVAPNAAPNTAHGTPTTGV